MTKGEAAFGSVDLHRGDADVEHHAIDAVEAEIVSHARDLREARLDEGEASCRALDQRLAFENRLGVAIEREDACRFAEGKQGPAVAAGAEGGVDIAAAIPDPQSLQRLGEENGNMGR